MIVIHLKFIFKNLNISRLKMHVEVHIPIPIQLCVYTFLYAWTWHEGLCPSQTLPTNQVYCTFMFYVNLYLVLD